MLISRLLMVDRGEGTLKVGIRRGCPQDRVLSPLLWCLIINGLTELLNGEDIYNEGYVDDIATAVRAIDDNTASGLAQNELTKVD